MAEPIGGAGRAGGLLFVAVLGFLAYLALGAIGGVLRWIAFAVLLAAALVLLRNVARRR